MNHYNTFDEFLETSVFYNCKDLFSNTSLSYNMPEFTSKQLIILNCQIIKLSQFIRVMELSIDISNVTRDLNELQNLELLTLSNIFANKLNHIIDGLKNLNKLQHLNLAENNLESLP